MANRIKMAKVSTIIELHRQGWSNRAIAKELGVHRDTVSRCLREANSKPAKAPTGSEDSKPAKAPSGVAVSRSDCEPYREAIEAGLESGLSARRIFQDLVEDGFQGQGSECLYMILSRSSASRRAASYRGCRPAAL